MILYTRKDFVEWFRKAPKYRLLNVTTPADDLVVPPRFISVCVTCMNRLSDLIQTLPKNIQDNADYPNAEFLLLDYNSTDGLEEWVHDTMREHLDSGRLRYCRTEASRFCPNHSRNVSFARSTGGKQKRHC